MTLTEPSQPRVTSGYEGTLREAIELLDEAAAIPSHAPSVDAALNSLILALDGHGTELLSEIQHSEPRLSGRVTELRRAITDLQNRARLLRHGRMHPSLQTTITRSQLVDLARTARELQSRESDIIFDALNTDLGVGD